MYDVECGLPVLKRTSNATYAIVKDAVIISAAVCGRAANFNLKENVSEQMIDNRTPRSTTVFLLGIATC